MIFEDQVEGRSENSLPESPAKARKRRRKSVRELETLKVLEFNTLHKKMQGLSGLDQTEGL